MRGSVAVFLSLFAVVTPVAVACSSSDPVASTPDASFVDGSVSDGTSPSDPNDSGSSDGGLTDGPQDDGKPFCQSAAAAGAAFCADFESSTDVADGWDDFTESGGATLTLETTIAKQNKSALAKFVSPGSGNGTAAFSTVATASGTKSKVALEFDGRFSFPNGPPSTNTLVLTIALRTGTGPSGHYFIDIERGASGWQLLATGTSGEPFLAFGDDLWHHFRLSYDGSGGQGETHLFIDGLGVATVSVAKGPPPGGAPATLNNLLIEHLGIDGDTSMSFYIDNVIVTYP